MAWLSWLLQLASGLDEKFFNLWEIFFGNEVSLGMRGVSGVPWRHSRYVLHALGWLLAHHSSSQRGGPSTVTQEMVLLVAYHCNSL